MQTERRQNYDLATLVRIAIVSALSSETPWPDYYEIYPEEKPENYDKELAIRNAAADRDQLFAALSLAAEAQERKRGD